MNASEQAHTPELACKIAQITLLFQQEFADAKPDLSPWLRDPDTQDTVDPDSIDINFNFPGRKPNCQSRSILAQIRFSETLMYCTAQIIGIELSGHDHIGQQWRLSTVGHWPCEGKALPTPYAQDRLRTFCGNTFQLFRDEPSGAAALNEVEQRTRDTYNAQVNQRDSAEPTDDWHTNSSMADSNLDLDLDPDRWEPCDWSD